MKRYRILHRTYYNFSGLVQLGPHTLHLRPRVGHDLLIESSTLKITPPATLRWQRDIEDNSVAIATFAAATRQLMIESNLIIQQHNLAPLDFLVADYAVNYPFAYLPADLVLLTPYLDIPAAETPKLSAWIAGFWQPQEQLQTYDLLQRLNQQIHRDFTYRLREEPGVQTASQTLACRTGSCRDFANLFMCAARQLGLAARFVSGYLHAPPSASNYGATHAWAEVYLPGAGWTGFDPTTGDIVGSDHFAVAVARLPEAVPPVSGTFFGPPGTTLDVGVWVTELRDPIRH